ncbi:hypothetical protein CYMTET_40735 [Cymbomonas tetramitiformis]|uniref:Uncharacterized protein n=1 Tax=Cymbomonas tetramitiformis TaxID=36881 RepID=A0AAE0C8V0_9CHLO|nr:hypothetical protein CYMTET_40735 [Cymbomonas tetramitiformis]
MDCVYQLDKERSPNALKKEKLQRFLEDFDAKTSVEAWSISIFCGFLQQIDFLEIDGAWPVYRPALQKARPRWPRDSRRTERSADQVLVDAQNEYS